MQDFRKVKKLAKNYSEVNLITKKRKIKRSKKLNKFNNFKKTPNSENINFLIFIGIALILLFILPLFAFGMFLPYGPNNILGFIKSNTTSVTIDVFDHVANKKLTMPLEEYTLGVLAAEMPASFETEALKAQAICSRTFAYGRKAKLYGVSDKHPDCAVCTDFGHCQAFINKETFISQNNDSGISLWSKLQKAVNDTQGILIFYDGKPANPLFHANSGGTTENIEDVWGGSKIPYLKSVISLGEDLDVNYLDKKTIEPKEFLSKLKITKKYTSKEILAMTKYDRSSSGRVKNVIVCGNSFNGTDFRQTFNLRSTNFLVEDHESKIIISTCGYGHGVGMSQRGANYLALNGGNYKEILKHYYSGIELSQINDINMLQY